MYFTDLCDLLQQFKYSDSFNIDIFKHTLRIEGS